MNNSYPKYKKILWRFGRVFISAYFIMFSSYLINLQGLPTGEELLKVAVIPALIAGINATGKALREYFEDEGDEKVLKQLPF